MPIAGKGPVLAFPRVGAFAVREEVEKMEKVGRNQGCSWAGLARAEQYLGPSRVLSDRPELGPTATRAISTWPKPSPPRICLTQARIYYVLQIKEKMFTNPTCISLDQDVCSCVRECVFKSSHPRKYYFLFKQCLSFGLGRTYYRLI